MLKNSCSLFRFFAFIFMEIRWLLERKFCSLFLNGKKFSNVFPYIICYYFIFSSHTQKIIIFLSFNCVNLISNSWTYLNLDYKSTSNIRIGIIVILYRYEINLHFFINNYFRFNKFCIFSHYFKQLLFLSLCIITSSDLMLLCINILFYSNKNMTSIAV